MAGSAASTGSDQETVPPAPAQPYAAAPVVAAPVAAAPVVAAPVVARPAPSHGCSPLNPAARSPCGDAGVPAAAPAQTELSAVPASARRRRRSCRACRLRPRRRASQWCPGRCAHAHHHRHGRASAQLPNSRRGRVAPPPGGAMLAPHDRRPTAPEQRRHGGGCRPFAALADDELAVAPLSALGGGPPPPFDDILAVPAAAPDAADAAPPPSPRGAGDGATPARQVLVLIAIHSAGPGLFRHDVPFFPMTLPRCVQSECCLCQGEGLENLDLLSGSPFPSSKFCSRSDEVSVLMMIRSRPKTSLFRSCRASDDAPFALAPPPVGPAPAADAWFFSRDVDVLLLLQRLKLMLAPPRPSRVVVRRLSPPPACRCGRPQSRSS